ncbi:PREDICTED: translation initiation factor IF-2-like [Rhinopithecus bieti]|uniref:translation initiation factor IF-2-like n=1 Tax=Rhinopithecus bieti TaxID=61621 RepID=UPI00083BEBFB|nr:PREDICTED: translation initiation factor IF-2-like [Rhinopithecus bieti]
MSAPLPQRPGRDEGLARRGGRCRNARARPWAPGRAGLDVARAPLGSPPPPAGAPARKPAAGGGVRGARWRAPRGTTGVVRFLGARSRPQHAAYKPGPGAAREKRARGLGARTRPTQGCSCLRVTLPRQPGPSREQVAGMPAPGRGGRWCGEGRCWEDGVPVGAWVPAIRASHRKAWRGHRRDCGAFGSTSKELRSHPRIGRGLERRCLPARARTLRPGRGCRSPGPAGPSRMGLRVEPNLGK